MKRLLILIALLASGISLSAQPGPASFSPVATNTVHISGGPKLQAPSSFTISPLTCDTKVVVDTMSLVNSGNAPLEIRATTVFLGPDASRYQWISPPLPTTIDPGDTIRAVIRFDGTGMPNGTFQDLLRLYTNDPDGAAHILLYGAVEPRRFTVNWPVIDLGDVDVGSRRDTMIVYINRNSFRDSILQVSSESDTSTISMYKVEIRGDTTIMWVKFTPHAMGPFSARYSLRISPCNIDTTVIISGYGRQAIISAAPGWLLSRPVCSDTAFGRFAVGNRGNRPLYLRSPVFTGPGMSELRVISPSANQFPLTVDAGDSAWLTIRVVHPTASPLNIKALLQDDHNESYFANVAVNVTIEDMIRLVVPEVVDFGDGCIDGDGIVTIPLRNVASKTAFRITGVDAVSTGSPFSGDLPQSVVNAGDTLWMTLHFRPQGVGEFSDTLLLQYAPCGFIEKVVVKGRGIDVGRQVSPSAIIFGDVPTKVESRRSLVIRNAAPPGSPDLIVDALSIIPPVPGLTIISPTIPPQRHIAPGDSLEIVVGFKPTDVSPLTDVHLHATTTGPCSSTLSLPITGRGISGILVASREDLDFGRTTRCDRRFDSIVIRNLTSNPITITRIDIEPIGAPEGFGWQTRTAIPAIVAPDDSIVVGVYLLNVGQADGPISTKLVLTTDTPFLPRLEIPLFTTRVSESLRLVGPGFDPARTDLQQQRMQFVVNDGTEPVTITRIDLSSPFTVISTSPVLPATLEPNDTLSILVEFAPLDTGNYSRDMVVHGPFHCDTATILRIDGRGVETELVTARWEDVEGAPGDIVRIPLRIDGTPSEGNVTTYRIGLRYNSTMLKPIGIVLDGTLSQGWKITDRTSGADTVTFTAAGDAPIVGPGVLAYIEMQVLLGESTHSSLVPIQDTLSFGSTALLRVGTGTFTLTGYCRAGDSPRLLRTQSGFGIKRVTPTPASNLTQVEIQTVENGETRLLLYDGLGRRIAVLLAAPLAPGTYRVPVDLTSLSAGTYYVVLQTPTDNDRTRVIIAR